MTLLIILSIIAVWMLLAGFVVVVACMRSSQLSQYDFPERPQSQPGQSQHKELSRLPKNEEAGAYPLRA